jgi:hypothetical protein
MNGRSESALSVLFHGADAHHRTGKCLDWRSIEIHNLDQVVGGFCLAMP